MGVRHDPLSQFLWVARATTCSPQRMLSDTNYYLTADNLNEGTIIVVPAIHLFALRETGYAGAICLTRQRQAPCWITRVPNDIISGHVRLWSDNSVRKLSLLS